MKKLLSILTITTLSASTPAPLLANTTLSRAKRDVETTKTDVNTRVIKTDGANKPTVQQIKDRMKELNSQLDITKINVTNITHNSATITSTAFSGHLTLNFKVDKSIDLKKIIINTDLGSIITDGIKLPTIEQIKDRMKELNPQLDITKINVTNITHNSATITSNDNTFYSGNPLNVNYTISIKSFITNTDLGSIITDGIKLPTIEQIKDRMKELNNKLKDVKFHSLIKNIEITDIKPTSAKVNYLYPHIYSDTVDINFTSNINLDKIITNNNLGEFITNNLSNPTKQQIKDKLKELNPQLDITKINVTNITHNSAAITSNDENIYTKNVIVNYTVSIISLNW